MPALQDNMLKFMIRYSKTVTEIAEKQNIKIIANSLVALAISWKKMIFLKLEDNKQNSKKNKLNLALSIKPVYAKYRKNRVNRIDNVGMIIFLITSMTLFISAYPCMII